MKEGSSLSRAFAVAAGGGVEAGKVNAVFDCVSHFNDVDPSP